MVADPVRLWDEPQLAQELIARVVGLYQAKRKARPDPAADSDPSTALTTDEIAAGRSVNAATQAGYRDPLLQPVDDLSDDVELDRLWSTMKTLRAGNDSDKLYPAGLVYNISCASLRSHDR